MGRPYADRQHAPGEGRLLRRLRLYRAAGVHVYTDADVVLSANASWVMLHIRARGAYTVCLPRRVARVTDVTCDKVVATNTDRFTYPLEKFQTTVLLLDD